MKTPRKTLTRTQFKQNVARGQYKTEYGSKPRRVPTGGFKDTPGANKRKLLGGRVQRSRQLPSIQGRPTTSRTQGRPVKPPTRKLKPRAPTSDYTKPKGPTRWTPGRAIKKQQPPRPVRKAPEYITGTASGFNKPKAKKASSTY